MAKLNGPSDPSVVVQRRIEDAAARALAEAEQRRKLKAAEPQPAREIDGRGGNEPVRYGDWEVKGLASDF